MWDFTGCGKWLYTKSLSRMLTHSYGHLAISKHRSFFKTNLSYCAVVCALQCCRLFIVLAAVLEDCGIHRSKIPWGPRSECVKARERERSGSSAPLCTRPDAYVLIHRSRYQHGRYRRQSKCGHEVCVCIAYCPETPPFLQVIESRLRQCRCIIEDVGCWM